MIMYSFFPILIIFKSHTSYNMRTYVLFFDPQFFKLIIKDFALRNLYCKFYILHFNHLHKQSHNNQLNYSLDKGINMSFWPVPFEICCKIYKYLICIAAFEFKISAA
jgi:hypothetical protein